MTDRPRSAPMPASLRQGRPPRHPALAVRCPHCAAAPDMRCTTRTGRTRVQRLAPCAARLEAHAIATAVCTTCQVAPGTECRTPDGRPLGDIHPARRIEAGGNAA
ncbi:hypothetical protein [Streptomyces katrae]|uniref:zinc finger domain-containing protein n=1 Tax=Streptomyces katrae TaxID=68223 RepID=UPI0004C1F2F5|nr:hypothetical protein [Streptomyces katrae]